MESLKKLEEITHRLVELESDFERLFLLSQELLGIADSSGYFKELNPAWGRYLGWSIDELKAKPFKDFVHPDDRNKTESVYDSMKVGNKVSGFENRYVCSDGVTYKRILWTSTPIVKGEKCYFHAVPLDGYGDK